MGQTGETDSGTSAKQAETVTPLTVEPNIRVLKNGTRYDLTKGRIVSGPTKPHFTKENSGQMQALAREARYRKARAEMVRAAEQHSGKTGLTPAGAYAVMAGEFTMSALANAMDKPRDAVPAAKLVLHMADMAPAEAKAEERGPVIRIELRAEVAEGIRRLFPEVVEGEVREVED